MPLFFGRVDRRGIIDVSPNRDITTHPNPHTQMNIAHTATVLSLTEGFRAFVLRRSAVRLESGNYQGAPEAYREDRNRIRRDTARFNRAYKRLVDQYGLEDAANAISEASKGERLTHRGFDHQTGKAEWEFTPCQYSPVEIRSRAACIAERALAACQHRRRYTPYEAVAIVEGRREADEEQVLDAWQWLVETGTISHLQGSLQAMAQSLMRQGLIG